MFGTFYQNDAAMGKRLPRITVLLLSTPMRKIAMLLLVSVIAVGAYFYGLQQGTNSVPHALNAGSWQVFYSPRGGCTAAVVKELDAAKTNILVQAYSFTSDAIAAALVNAHKRGVKISVILDRGARSDKYSEADFVAHAGIRTLIDAKHAIAHNKVMIIDGATVITGSFNFTKAAEEKNAENLLVIHDVEMAKRYARNWQEHEVHCEEYGGR